MNMPSQPMMIPKIINNNQDRTSSLRTLQAMTSEQKKPDNAAFANKDAKNKKVFQEFKYAETIDQLNDRLKDTYFYDQNPEKVRFIKEKVFRQLNIKDNNFPNHQSQLVNPKREAEDFIQLTNLACVFMKYPLAQRAEKHRMANRLGNLDLSMDIRKTAMKYFQIYKNNRKAKLTISEEDRMRCQDFYQENKQTQMCPCCNLPVQKQSLSILTEIQQISNIGVSTILFFFAIKIMILIFLVMFLIFCSYSILTNINATRLQKQRVGMGQFAWVLGPIFYTKLKDSKQIHNSLEIINSNQIVKQWLALVLVFIWGLIFLIMKNFQMKKQIQIDRYTITPSDYTLIFRDVSRETKNKSGFKQMLQEQLQKYRKKMVEKLSKEFPQQVRNQKVRLLLELGNQQIKIHNIFSSSRFCITTNQVQQDYRVKRTIKKLQHLQQKFINWIKHRNQQLKFNVKYPERKKEYDKYQNQKNKLLENYRETYNFIIQQKNQQTQKRKNVDLFVIFEKTQNKEFIQLLHDKQYISCLNWLPCMRRQFFSIELQKGGKECHLIEDTPQPQDLIWTSTTQRQQRYKITIKTFSISIFIIMCSFWIIYGLTRWQQHIQKANVDSSNLSIFITLIIVLINILIQQFCTWITKKQQHPTYNIEQDSIGTKSLIIQFINTVLVIFAVNIFANQLDEGLLNLAKSVLSFSVISVITTLLRKIIVISYWWKLLERKIYYDSPFNKIKLTQKQLNGKYENPPFLIGSLYAQLINMYLFGCFYASLQPLIIPFCILCLFFNYWGNKFSLFYCLSRPIPGDNSINSIMQHFVYSGPLFFTIGNLIFSGYLSQDKFQISLSTYISLGLSILLIVFPYRLIATKYQYDNPRRSFYNQDKPFFQYEYQHLFPLTAQKSVQQYNRYLKILRLIIDKKQNNVKQMYNWQFMASNKYDDYKTVDQVYEQFIDYDNLAQNQIDEIKMLDKKIQEQFEQGNIDQFDLSNIMEEKPVNNQQSYSNRDEEEGQIQDSESLNKPKIANDWQRNLSGGFKQQGFQPYQPSRSGQYLPSLQQSYRIKVNNANLNSYNY